MTMRIVVVCEGPSDPPLVCGLADRVLREHVDWLREQPALDGFRSYVGLEGENGYLTWIEVKERFAKERIRLRRYGQEKSFPDQVPMLKALLLIAARQRAASEGEIAGVLIFRDADHQPERRRGLETGRDEFVERHEAPRSPHPWREHIAIAVAEPKNEAWVLAGFEPANESELAALTAAREELGFAPNEFPAELDAREHGAKREAKRVLDQICPDTERRSQCWRETPLDTLRQRGERCGLAQFLDEVRERLAPLFGGSMRSA
jgi:hypothetical protein